MLFIASFLFTFQVCTTRFNNKTTFFGQKKKKQLPCDGSDGIATITKRKNRLREVSDLPKVTQQTHGGAGSGLISDSALYCGM